ncbi:MAG: type II secretion system protein [bacterium]|nr:type II secretion system protein [bacterium]
MKQKDQSGFSLIELLVVVSILGVLTSLLILYSRDSERQLTLIREQSKLVSTILRAKSLAVQTFIGEGPTCGYGVHFSENDASYTLFKDAKINNECSANDKVLTDANEWEETVDLSSLGVQISSGQTSDIFFIPPDPQVAINGAVSSVPVDVIVDLSIIINGQLSTRSIKINNAGQVSTQ